MRDQPFHHLAAALARYARDTHGKTPRRVRVVFDFGEDAREGITIPGHELANAPEATAEDLARIMPENPD
jgi:hypothetical protein